MPLFIILRVELFEDSCRPRLLASLQIIISPDGPHKLGTLKFYKGPHIPVLVAVGHEVRPAGCIDPEIFKQEILQTGEYRLIA